MCVCVGGGGGGGAGGAKAVRHDRNFCNFFLICFFMFMSYMSRVVLLNLLDTKVNPKLLIISQRERERERELPKSSREGVVGWCDGAWKIFRAEASY